MHPNPIFSSPPDSPSLSPPQRRRRSPRTELNDSPDGAVMARLVTADGTDVGKVTFQ